MALFVTRFDEDGSKVLGAYFQNGWCIELSEDKIVLINDERFNFENFPVFVHEYWHYLQNISTIIGAIEFIVYQNLLAAFTRTLQSSADGRSSGMTDISPEDKDISRVIDYLRYLDILHGEEKPRQFTNGIRYQSLKVTGERQDSIRFPIGDKSGPLSIVLLEITAITESGAQREYQYRFGTIAIQEGIAYEIEKLVATDLHVEAIESHFFPYCTLRSLAEYLCPGLSTYEICALATHALLRNNPSSSLILYLKEYCKLKNKGFSVEQAINKFFNNYNSLIEQDVGTLLHHDLPNILLINRNRGLVGYGIETIIENYIRLLARRINNPIFELRPFSGSDNDILTTDGFMRDVLPCDTLQKYPGDADSPTKDILVSFNMPDQDGNDNPLTISDGLRALQCQLHYLLNHLGNRLFLSSREAEQLHGQNELKCPFYNCCKLSLRTQYAETCKNRPWEIYIAQPQTHCWYGSAVASCLGTYKVTKVR